MTANFHRGNGIVMPPIRRGRAEGWRSADAKRKDDLIARASAKVENPRQAAISIHAAYYGETAVTEECDQRSEQLKYLRSKVIAFRRIQNN